MRTAVLILVGYLLGSVPAGVAVVAVLRPGVDLRAVGSGNVGTSNVFRNAGLRPAAVVGPLQFAQGLGPVLLARGAGLTTTALGAVALATVAGSGWPVWLRFNGGRAVAVATGAVAGLGLAGLACLLACFAVGLLAGEIAAGVLVGFVLLPAVEALAWGRDGALVAAALLGMVLLRRLEGVGADLEDHPGVEGIVRARLLRDRRPGRPLVGPRPGR